MRSVFLVENLDRDIHEVVVFRSKPVATVYADTKSEKRGYYCHDVVEYRVFDSASEALEADGIA